MGAPQLLYPAAPECRGVGNSGAVLGSGALFVRYVAMRRVGQVALPVAVVVMVSWSRRLVGLQWWGTCRGGAVAWRAVTGKRRAVFGTVLRRGIIGAAGWPPDRVQLERDATPRSARGGVDRRWLQRRDVRGRMSGLGHCAGRPQHCASRCVGRRAVRAWRQLL